MNRTHVTGMLLALTVAACSSTPSPPLTIGIYDNLKDEHAYWVKEFEVGFETWGKKGKGYPPAFKSCFADEMVRTSPPALHDAVATFIGANNTKNSDAIGAALGKTRSSIWTSSLLETALRTCQPVYFTALYDQFSAVSSYRDFSMTLLKVAAERDGIDMAEYPKEIMDCSIDAYWRTLPNDLRKPIDAFLQDRSRENWQAIYEKFAAYGNLDRSRTTRLIGQCKAKYPPS